MCRLTRREKWITPFMKQCFAVSSVVLNMISHGMTSGYNASLFSELRKTREIPLDVDSESWLASLIGVTLLVGSVVNSFVMEIIGRKPAILLSSVLTICGWISFSLASSFPALLIGKIFQGISVGIGGSVGSILIGEYTSPRYRGPFIAAVPTAILVGILISHTFGMSYGWHDLSSVLLFFSLPGLIVAVFSPESPSFLVTKGRYDECRKVFRWLRGTDEDNELETMIETDKILKKTKRAYTGITLQLIRIKLTYVVAAFKKREFRIPVIIMTHLNAILEFCGSIMSDIYALDVHTAFYGTDVYMFTVITSLDVLRLVATVSGIYITSRVKRRSMMLILVSLNVIVNLSIAGYIYVRQRGLLPFDHVAIGLFLHHFLYFIIGAGPMPLSVIISGEIFPLADRGLCSIISRITCSIYMFGDIKSAPYLFTIVGVEGVFGLYGLILAYSLVVTLIYLPETKERTLQEVEDGFRGYAIGEREEALELKCNELKDDL